MPRWDDSATCFSSPANHISTSRSSKAKSSASTSRTPPTPASSTSPFPGARMKLVGGDSGRVEHEAVRRLGGPRSQRAGDRGRHARPAGRLRPRAPDTRAHVSARRHRTSARIVPSRPLEEAFAQLRTNPEFAEERARLDAEVEAEPRQDARLRRRDGHGGAEPRRGRAAGLRLSDASRGGQRGAGQVPEVRHEAPAGGRADRLCLPDASGGDERPTRPLPEVRDEAGTGAPRRKRAGRSTSMHEHGDHSAHHDQLSSRAPWRPPA